jgi:hypothetical protein
MRNAAFGGLLGGIGSNINAFAGSSLNPWAKPKASSSSYVPRRF